MREMQYQAWEILLRGKVMPLETVSTPRHACFSILLTGAHHLEGITKKFDGWGQSIAGAAGSKPPTSSARKVETTTKSSIGQKKPAPSAAPKKTLPAASSTTQRKALPASAKRSTSYSKSASKPATRPQYPRANSDATGASKPKPAASKSTAQPKTGYSKPTTNAAGKTVMQKQSVPSSKSKPSTASKQGGGTSYQGPLPVGDKKVGGSDFKPHGGYQGPLNLGGLGDGKSKSSGQQKPLGSSNSGKGGGGSAGKPGGYGGPLNLGSLG
jgi:translation initiation factor IF-2